MPKTRFLRLFAVGLLLGPSFAAAQGHVISTLLVAMPENWGLADDLGLFALVGVISTVLIRRRILRPKKFEN